MTKQEYRHLMRNAQRKKGARLTKKEMNEIEDALMKMGFFRKKENFTEKPKIKSIGEILNG